MTNPECSNPADDVITDVMVTLRQGFDPDSLCPPVGGGSTDVKFFVGAGAPLSAFDANIDGNGGECPEPFLWVRLDSRFNTQSFPNEALCPDPCNQIEVIVLELGAARCTQLTAEVDWAVLKKEAEISLDDSWRLNRILRAASGRVQKMGYQAATDSLVVYGPEGGVTAWSGMLYIGF